jgi:hypothetical protein
MRMTKSRCVVSRFLNLLFKNDKELNVHGAPSINAASLIIGFFYNIRYFTGANTNANIAFMVGCLSVGIVC